MDRMCILLQHFSGVAKAVEVQSSSQNFINDDTRQCGEKIFQRMTKAAWEISSLIISSVKLNPNKLRSLRKVLRVISDNYFKRIEHGNGNVSKASLLHTNTCVREHAVSVCPVPMLSTQAICSALIDETGEKESEKSKNWMTA